MRRWDRKRGTAGGFGGMANGFLMEVCVDSVESAVNAERGGAGRLELCASLMEGGTTPSIGLLQVVKQCIRVPVFVMIRPRGGDFLYSDREVEVMKADIRLAKQHGADGMVFGALTEDGRIDTELCTALLERLPFFTRPVPEVLPLPMLRKERVFTTVEVGSTDHVGSVLFTAAARPLPVTFHRAFDMVYDPLAALETLISMGFERVLTSGCDTSALEGLPLIKRLTEQAKGRIIVMPGRILQYIPLVGISSAQALAQYIGGGITERNLQRILEGSGASEFHCSARSAKDSGMKFRNSSVTMGAYFSAPEYSIKVADVAKVRTLNAIAKNVL